MIKLTKGEAMLDHNNIEKLFYAIDEIASLYSAKRQMNGIEGVATACNVIFAADQEDKEIRNIIESVKELKLGKEEIRKAFQLAVLKRLKQEGRSNSFITPDTIGVLVSYLVERLAVVPEEPTIFDPLVGTGNLLASVVNNLDRKTTAIGCDIDKECGNLAMALMNMLGEKANIILADTLSLEGVKADIIVTDFPFSDESEHDYFPYKVLEHHYDNLINDGYVVSVIPNDFFDITDTRDYRDSILAKYLAIGLIKLPDDLFKKLGKSILILRKKTDAKKKNENFLIAEIPSFADQDEFKKTLAHINDWFDRYIDRKDK